MQTLNRIQTANKLNTSYFWNNKTNNKLFYEKVSPKKLQDYAKRAGTHHCDDLCLISNEINQYATILDIGSGYGRTLEYLKNSRHRGKIISVEQSTSLSTHLRNNYSRFCRIINQDILQFSYPEVFDTVLWLWSGISDFTFQEQRNVFNIIYDHLDEHGVLYLESHPHNRSIAISSVNTNQFYKVSDGNLLAHGYIPSIEEVSYLAKYAGFKKITVLPYLNQNNTERTLYRIEK